MKQAFIIILLITVVLLIYKSILYLRKFPNKKLFCWLFFGRDELMLSSTTARRSAKEQQNLLSIVVLIGFIVSLFLYFLMS